MFVTEKFGNAGWILNEMNIKGRPVARRKIAAGRCKVERWKGEKV